MAENEFREEDMDFYKSKISYDDAIRAIVIIAKEVGANTDGLMGPWPVVWEVQRSQSDLRTFYKLRQLLKVVTS